jgi:hypothetical protein
MAKPLTRAQALENRAFLKLLRKTGNVRLACRELGLKYGTMQHRRRVQPAFAAQVDAALVFAQARFAAVRRRAPSIALRAVPLPRKSGGGYRTSGGEPVIVRLASGAIQVRRAQAGKITREGEQAYLAALSATCNKRLAAAAVGAAGNAFARRCRKDAAFAREERMAVQRGYETLELALLASGLPGSHEHDDWRSNDPPAMPPMSVSQALQLMYLHQKEARLNAVAPHAIRRRAREPEEAYHERLVRMAEERLRRGREEFEVAEALRMERGEPAWGPAGEAVRAALRQAQDGPESEGRVVLPDLAQVTGWSTADPEKVPHNAGRALFGGWRMAEMERKLRDGS